MLFVTISADESMGEIIQAKYTDFSADDADYPDTSNIMKLSSFPKPVPTKSSLSLVHARQREMEKAMVINMQYTSLCLCHLTSLFVFF